MLQYCKPVVATPALLWGHAQDMEVPGEQTGAGAPGRMICPGDGARAGAGLVSWLPYALEKGDGALVK